MFSLLDNFLDRQSSEYTDMKLGLERVRSALETLGNPERSYPSVLIAGTNGKGSTARMVESVLRSTGVKTGLYTSPHLERFNERILIGGEEVSDDVLNAVLQNFQVNKEFSPSPHPPFGAPLPQGERGTPIVGQAPLPLGERDTQSLFIERENLLPVGETNSNISMHAPLPLGERVAAAGGRVRADLLTWFERATLLAFEIFRREKIDIAILEVGLGGRLDATNVVEPLVSAITSISRDHTEVLGESLFDIAREKAGVMREGKPIVLGLMDAEVRTFLQKATRMAGAQPVVPQMPVGIEKDFNYAEYSHLSLGLEGRHQLKNAAVAIEILKELRTQGFFWDEGQLREGLLQARNPGRLEWLEGRPPILMDGAHNEEALRALVDYVREEGQGGGAADLTIILGMMADKDCRAAIQILKPLQPRWIFSEVSSPRSLKISQWQGLAKLESIVGEFFTSPESALERAAELTSADGEIVVTGSLYLVGELRRCPRASGGVPGVS